MTLPTDGRISSWVAASLPAEPEHIERDACWDQERPNTQQDNHRDHPGLGLYPYFSPSGLRTLIIPHMATAQPTPANPFLSIHAIPIFVRDLDRSLRFYVDQLDFNLLINARPQSA